MRICLDLRRQLDPEMAAYIEHQFANREARNCLVECPDCRSTAGCTRLAGGDLVIQCSSCGYHKQGRWTDRPAPPRA